MRGAVAIRQLPLMWRSKKRTNKKQIKTTEKLDFDRNQLSEDIVNRIQADSITNL